MQAQYLNFFRIFNRPANLFAKRKNILLANEGSHLTPHHLFRLITEQALGRRSFVQNPPVTVEDGEAVGRVFDERAKTVVAAAKLLTIVSQTSELGDHPVDPGGFGRLRD